jgi:hypothetical protein
MAQLFDIGSVDDTCIHYNILEGGAGGSAREGRKELMRPAATAVNAKDNPNITHACHFCSLVQLFFVLVREDRTHAPDVYCLPMFFHGS